MSTPDSLWWLKHPVMTTYGVPVLSVGAALIIARRLDMHFHDAPVSLFICAVMFSAWFGGFKPGLLAAVLSCLAFIYYFVPRSIHSPGRPPRYRARHCLRLPPSWSDPSVLDKEVQRRRCGRVNSGIVTTSRRSPIGCGRQARTIVSPTSPCLASKASAGSANKGGISPPTSRRNPRSDAFIAQRWRDVSRFRNFRYRTIRPDGSIVYIEASGKPVFDRRFLGYRGVSGDVTAEVRAEQVEKALHQAQAELARVMRVTALGELAASIAHEVNQPLAAIIANANACLHWLEADRADLDSVRDALAAVVKDGDRAAAVITRIRAFLSGSSVAHRPCDAAGVIGEVLFLVEPELGRHGILLQTSLAPDLPPVTGDRIQLQQVFLNLVLNGAEAMRAVLPKRRRMVAGATVDHRDDGPWVIVTVEDAGVGFGDAEATRVFEAFYTTKPGGLGMGLAISRSIIDSHRGRLWAKPNPDYGTTFHLALPGMR